MTFLNSVAKITPILTLLGATLSPAGVFDKILNKNSEYSQGELTQAYLNGEEAQREDEFATSFARRDYLKDRLIFQVGAGSKFASLGDIGLTGPISGSSPIAWGATVEYVTKWHFAPFFSYGIVPKSKDQEHDDDVDMDFSALNRFGVTYYFFPKSPLHLGVSASYGTTYYAHKSIAEKIDGMDTRKIILNKGWNFEGTVTYLENEWYFLTLHVGISSSDKRLPGAENNTYNTQTGLSLVNTNDVIAGRLTENGAVANGVRDNNLSIGAGIGFALPELFPDKTERRLRERNAARDQ